MNLVDRSQLHPAKWNSTCYIVSPDYKRLSTSISKYGILHPITVQPNGTIIDGYHRWVIANELNIKQVPVTVVDCDDIDAMLLHIDMNRYRGIVIAKYLSRIIQRIHHSGRFEDDQLRKELALTKEEFELLLDGSLIKMRKIKQHSYSPAWVPIESKTGDDIIIERPTGHSEQV